MHLQYAYHFPIASQLMRRGRHVNHVYVLPPRRRRLRTQSLGNITIPSCRTSVKDFDEYYCTV
jgi:hypothetical protein